MQAEIWFMYLSVAAIATLTPGPAVLLVSSRCLESGLRSCLYIIVGNVIGLFLLCMATVLGLTTLLIVSGTAFTILKLAGAAYLINLGIRMFRDKNSSAVQELSRTASRRSAAAGYAEGVLLAISNPKAVLFTTALFPQFVDASMPLLSQFATMTVTLMLMSFFSLLAYACIARHLGKRRFGSWGKHTRKIVGGAYISLGASLAFTSK